jgi:ABC-2 type transport system permease protein
MTAGRPVRLATRPGALVAAAGPARTGGNTAAGPWAGFPEALHAEWTKLRTVPSTLWLLLTAVTLTAVPGVISSSIIRCPGSCSDDPAQASLAGVLVGQAAVAVLAVLLITSEYSSGMIRISLTAIPRRTTMLVAKAAVLTAVVVVTAVVAVLGSVLASAPLLAANGFTPGHGFLPLTLVHGPILRAAGGSVLYLALIALLSLGIAAAVRDSGVAVTVVLGLLYIVPIISKVLLSHQWELWLNRYAPANAGLAIQATRNLGGLPIGPWAGLGVLGLWAAAALVAGWALLRWRDA